MTKPSLCYRITASVFALGLFFFTNLDTLKGQDISGGASADIASAGDLESRLGIGVFTNLQNFAHSSKRLEKKTVSRPEPPARPKKQTTTGGNREPARTGGNRTGKPVKPALNAEALNDQGDDFFDAGEYEKAIESYKKAVGLQPKYPEAYLNLGNAYFNLARYDEAIAAYKKSVELKPDWAEPYNKLGDAYLKQERMTEAVEALQQAIHLDPKNSEPRNSLSQIYFDQGVAAYNAGKYTEAVAAYQQAVSIKSDYGEAHNNLGDAYRRLDKLTEATAAYKLAIHFKPNWVEPYRNLSWINDKLGRYASPRL